MRGFTVYRIISKIPSTSKSAVNHYLDDMVDFPKSATTGLGPVSLNFNSYESDNRFQH